MSVNTCSFTLLTMIITLFVFLSSKTDKSFPIYVDSQWIIAGHDDVNSQVELVTKQKQRIVNISAYYTSFVFWHILELVQDEDAFALRGALGFDYPHIALHRFLETSAIIDRLVSNFILAILEVFFELLLLLW